VRTPFRIVRHGVALTFDAHSLYVFVASTGDTRDPMTRTQLTPFELRRLGRACGRLLPSTADLHRLFRAEIERRAVVDYLTDDALRAPGVETMVDVLAQLRAVATPSELRHVRMRVRRVFDVDFDDDAAATGEQRCDDLSWWGREPVPDLWYE
jgi:hypothetical protein